MKTETIRHSFFLLIAIIFVLFCSGCASQSGSGTTVNPPQNDIPYETPDPVPASIYIACPSCDRQIPVESDFCMYCGKPVYPNSPSQNEPSTPVPATPQPSVVPTSPPQPPKPTSIPVTPPSSVIPTSPPQNLTPTSPQSSVWSNWSTTPISASAGIEVQTRTVVKEYHMVHYGTQAAEPPYVRMFRNYSILGSFDKYGARDSYGEKHFTRTVTAEELDRATKYQPGLLIPGDYTGYQKGSDVAYYFGDDKYVWFIESFDPVIEYRYRNIK